MSEWLLCDQTESQGPMANKQNDGRNSKLIELNLQCTNASLAPILQWQEMGSMHWFVFNTHFLLWYRSWFMYNYLLAIHRKVTPKHLAPFVGHISLVLIRISRVYNTSTTAFGGTTIHQKASCKFRNFTVRESLSVHEQNAVSLINQIKFIISSF